MKTILTVLGICIFFIACGGGDGSTPPPPPPPDDDWSTKILNVEQTIRDTHPSPFNFVSSTDFSNQMTSLANRADSMAESDIALDLAKVLASVKDAHTSVNLINYFSAQRMPLEFRWINDALVVNKVDESISQLLGKRLVSINQISVGQLSELAAPYISTENEFWQRYILTEYLRILPFVNTLTESANEELTLEFASDNFQTETIMLSASTLSNPVTYAESQAHQLLSESDSQNIFHRVVSENNMVYMRVQGSVNASDQSHADAQFDAVIEEISGQGHNKLIVDFRDFVGGNSQILRPGISRLATLQQSNQMQIILLTGNKTFSSALINLYDFINQLDTTTVGVETGGKPAHYGDIFQSTIPGTSLGYFVSKQYFELDNESLSTYTPVHIVRAIYEDYLAGIDTQLVYALTL